MEKKHVTISKEYLAKIRNLAAIRPEAEFEYTPLAYRDFPSELQPVFTLVPISGPDALRAEDALRGSWSMQDGKNIVMYTNRGAFVNQVCTSRVRGWRNYYDENGNVIEFDASLSCLPEQLLTELCEAITERKRRELSEEERLG